MGDIVGFFTKQENIAIAVLGLANVVWFVLYMFERKSDREDMQLERVAREAGNQKAADAIERNTLAMHEVAKAVAVLAAGNRSSR